jgi:hypothetical protein
LANSDRSGNQNKCPRQSVKSRKTLASPDNHIELRSLCKYSSIAIATPKINHRRDRSVQIIIKVIALQERIAKQEAETLLKKYRDLFGDISD